MGSRSERSQEPKLQPSSAQHPLGTCHLSEDWGRIHRRGHTLC